MCRQYLSYKIPTSHLSSGKCKLIKDGKFKTCSCGKFTYVIVGRYRSKTDIISVSKTNMTEANKLYKKLYPFRVFKISKGIKDNCCRTCGTMIKKSLSKKVKQPLDVDKKLEMSLDSIIRYNLDLKPYELIPENNEPGCNGDSIFDPFVTKKKLDEDLDNIEKNMSLKHYTPLYRMTDHTNRNCGHFEYWVNNLNNKLSFINESSQNENQSDSSSEDEIYYL